MFLQYFLKFLITQQSHVYSFLWLQLPEHRVRAVSEHLLVVNLMMKNLTFVHGKSFKKPMMSWIRIQDSIGFLP